jgi:hypothetical protein
LLFALYQGRAEGDRQDPRDDLPGYSDLVFEPAAFHGLSAFRKFFQHFIDFFLSRAIDYKGDSGRELVGLTTQNGKYRTLRRSRRII